MNTIKIEIRKNITEEHEIALPVYRKHNDNFVYKVYSQDHCINAVDPNYGEPAIQVAHAGLAWNHSEAQDCTEAEFMEVYNRALEKLNNLAFKSVFSAAV